MFHRGKLFGRCGAQTGIVPLIVTQFRATTFLPAGRKVSGPGRFSKVPNFSIVVRDPDFDVIVLVLAKGHASRCRNLDAIPEILNSFLSSPVAH